MASSNDAARKFDTSRAGEYEQQSRIALAGYDACHELAACVLAATLGSGTRARILVAGAGGGAKERFNSIGSRGSIAMTIESSLGKMFRSVFKLWRCCDLRFRFVGDLPEADFSPNCSLVLSLDGWVS